MLETGSYGSHSSPGTDSLAPLLDRPGSRVQLPVASSIVLHFYLHKLSKECCMTHLHSTSDMLQP
eukprot:748379-Hanusia_phi.AAC.1